MHETGMRSRATRSKSKPVWSVIALAGCCFLHATFALGQSGWTQQFPLQAPAGRNFFAMAYDADRNETVVFGGIVNNSQVLGDTWVWNGAGWIQKTPPNSPPARFGHAMAYDAARQEVVLFGGLQANGSIEADTWVWNGTTWTQVFPAAAPPPRDLAAMTYDSVRSETILFGGRSLGSASGSMLDDTWGWDGVNWTPKTPATHPSGRNRARPRFRCVPWRSALVRRTACIIPFGLRRHLGMGRGQLDRTISGNEPAAHGRPRPRLQSPSCSGHHVWRVQ